MAGKYVSDCGGLKPIVIPKQKPKAKKTTAETKKTTPKATPNKKK